MLKIKKNIIAVLGIILFNIFTYIIEPIISKNIKIITFSLILLIIVVYYFYCIVKNKKYNIKHIIYIILIIGVLLRTMYIVYTPITERQHDVYGIEDEGHLGYIYRIFETGKLPQTNGIQFYHPPLFHAIAAGWLKVNSMLNVPMERSLEGIQIISAMFSSFILLVAYKITNEIDLKDKYKLILNLFMAVYPSFIILAGSINNDVLLVLLQFLIILYLIKWNKETSVKNTIILAISTGLCVMTKLSGAIMAMPILFVFIKKLVLTLKNNKKDLVKLFLKFLMFGIISLPLGLWHPIRNYILFKQPLGGVLIPADIYYIGNYSDIQRFFSISMKQLFGELYCVLPYDYNLFAYIVKCSIFGEFTYSNIDFVATVIKTTNFILIMFSIIYTLKYIIYKKNNIFIIDLLIIFWITNILSFYWFNIKYPYICTMDFRYIVPSAYIGMTTMLYSLNNTKYNILRTIIESIIAVFEIFCIIMIFIIK